MLGTRPHLLAVLFLSIYADAQAPWGPGAGGSQAGGSQPGSGGQRPGGGGQWPGNWGPGSNSGQRPGVSGQAPWRSSNQWPPRQTVGAGGANNPWGWPGQGGQQPSWPWQGKGPQQPGPRQPQPQQTPVVSPTVTVTITRSAPGGDQTPWAPGGGGGAKPTGEPTWTQPSAWGPPRTPFGPGATQTGPQTIPTTTTDAPREPVPFMTECGGTQYVEEDVSNALIAGCWYKNKTQTKNGYPRVFANAERINFGDVQAPWYEFPLISSAAYVGGPPGPDRVIFNEACFLAGEITQTGAQGGAGTFKECQESY